jgi:hypothetical protein
MTRREQDASESIRPSRTGLSRRDLLALGPLLAATPWLERAAAAAALAGAPAPLTATVPTVQAPATAATAGVAAAATPVRPISVGYLEGSDGVPDLRRLAPDLSLTTVGRREDVLVPSRRVVPAAALPGGDSSLAGVPVRISIRGLYPPLPEPRPMPRSPAAAGLPRAIDLDFYVPSIELSGGAGYLFDAWSFRLLPAIDVSPTLSFRIVPDWYSDLAVTLSVKPARATAGARPRLSRAVFTLGDASGRPRFQRGAYLLAINPGVWDLPVDLPERAAAGSGLLSLLFTVSPEGVGR